MEGCRWVHFVWTREVRGVSPGTTLPRGAEAVVAESVQARDATAEERQRQDVADIAATLGGDGQAYERLVRRHQAAVARQMWRFTRDRGVLEELVQEVFVQAYFSLGRYEGRAPLAHWLSRIAVRVGYRHWKRKARQASDGLAEAHRDDGQATAAETLEAQEAAELVHAALAELGPADRLVVTLMHLEQRSVRETAELTGWTRAAVKVRALRARRRLGKVLERRGWS